MRRLTELETQYKQLSNRIDKHAERLWQLENPPKFKYGDNVSYAMFKSTSLAPSFMDAKVLGVSLDSGYDRYFDKIFSWKYEIDVPEMESVLSVGEDSLTLNKETK